jgi:quercetin dioxygenase-like cupin family protein
MITVASANMIAFDLEGLAEFDAAGPCLKVLAETGAARIVLVGLRAGQELPEQHVPSQLLIQVLRGMLILHTGDAVRAVQTGALVLLEERVPHRVEATDDCVLLITLTPSPLRRPRGRALPTVPNIVR